MRNEISQCNRHNQIIVRSRNSLLSHYSEGLTVLSSISFKTHNFESQYKHLGVISKQKRRSLSLSNSSKLYPVWDHCYCYVTKESLVWYKSALKFA